MSHQSARVGIVMGSRSDIGIMKKAAEILQTLEIPFEVRISSAHRTPDWCAEYAETAEERGLEVIIAGAGAAAALPGCIAAKTWLPVLGVPIDATPMGGMDALLCMAQMPGGVPVGTLAVGPAGAKNAALLAARMLGLKDDALKERLKGFIANQTQKVFDGGVEVSLEELGL
jgi:5-(carboxyamino)imidazole ribonucleotide mutase